MVTFDFMLNYMYCRPHVTVCLNLVYIKAEEEFSLLEMSATFISVGLMISNISLKYLLFFFFNLG